MPQTYDYRGRTADNYEYAGPAGPEESFEDRERRRLAFEERMRQERLRTESMESANQIAMQESKYKINAPYDEPRNDRRSNYDMAQRDSLNSLTNEVAALSRFADDRGRLPEWATARMQSIQPHLDKFRGTSSAPKSAYSVDSTKPMSPTMDKKTGIDINFNTSKPQSAYDLSSPDPRTGIDVSLPEQQQSSAYQIPGGGMSPSEMYPGISAINPMDIQNPYAGQSPSSLADLGNAAMYGFKPDFSAAPPPQQPSQPSMAETQTRPAAPVGVRAGGSWWDAVPDQDKMRYETASKAKDVATMRAIREKYGADR